MKKLLLFTLSFCLSLIGVVKLSAQTKKVYINPAFKTLSQHEKTLAIIPFDAVIKLRRKEMAKYTTAQITDMEMKEGKEVQNSLHNYLLEKKLTISIQSIKKTNALLRHGRINPDSMQSYTTQQLCQILGVDGIISGSIKSNIPSSQGAYITLGVLAGSHRAGNSGKCSISVNDSQKGKLVWKYKKTIYRGLGSDSNTIINSLMRKASREFPYNS
ncbi:MAG TPA: hypothetical protein VNE41_10100 [Chitinophagaceae bacterium]|nr:hypothetical protein [Chitinophagaceae bacterium]